MTSPLPPRRRDTTSLNDRVRQDRANLKQLYPGFVGGRFAPARRLGAATQLGDIEDDTEGDEETAAIAFLNTDAASASTAGRIDLHLTYVPVDGSLHVYWNGVALPPTEYVLSGQTVTFIDHLIHPDDALNAAYAYYPSDVAEVQLPEFIGFSTTTYSTPHIDIPAGTQAGDRLILVMNSYGAPTFSDARFTSTLYSAVKSGVLYQSIHEGTADGSGTAIPLTLGTFSGSQGFAALVVFRNTDSGTPVVKNGLSTDYPFSFPAATATEALGVLLPSYVTVPGGSDVDSTGDWDQILQVGIGWDISVHHFPAVTSPTTTPPGSFGYSGLPGDYTAVVIPLELS